MNTKIRTVALAFTLALTALSAPARLQAQDGAASTEKKADSAWDFEMRTIDGVNQPLSTYKGKVALFVNTASRCGFTPQYEGLEKLYQTYKKKDFVILGFPSNDFLWQEPGSDAEIKEFCRLKYGVSFPMFSKISVKGSDQAPLYRYLTTSGPEPQAISWNFNKILVGRDGKVIKHFGSRVKPESDELKAAIETALKGS